MFANVTARLIKSTQSDETSGYEEGKKGEGGAIQRGEHLLTASSLSRLRQIRLSQAIPRQIHLWRVRKGIHVEAVPDAAQARGVRKRAAICVSDMQPKATTQRSAQTTHDLCSQLDERQVHPKKTFFQSTTLCVNVTCFMLV